MAFLLALVAARGSRPSPMMAAIWLGGSLSQVSWHSRRRPGGAHASEAEILRAPVFSLRNFEPSMALQISRRSLPPKMLFDGGSFL